MQKIIYILFAIFFIIVIDLKISGGVNADSQSLFISEFMPDPTGSDSAYEWIELYNAGGTEINTAGYKINNISIPEFFLAPKKFLILARDKTSLIELFPGITAVEVSFSLSNSGGEIILSKESYTDKITYPKALENKSFERLGELCDGVSINTNGNTIGQINSNYLDSCWSNPESYPVSEPASSPIYTPPVSAPISFFQEIIGEKEIFILLISEVYPSPITQNGEMEWIEIYNPYNKEIDFSGYYIGDKSYKEQKSKSRYIFTEALIEENSYFIIESPPFSLNNSGDELYLYSPNGTVIDTVFYNSITNGSSAIRDENILYNGEKIELIKSSAPTKGFINSMIAITSNEKKTETKTEAKTDEKQTAGATLGYKINYPVVKPMVYWENFVLYRHKINLGALVLLVVTIIYSIILLLKRYKKTDEKYF